MQTGDVPSRGCHAHHHSLSLICRQARAATIFLLRVILKPVMRHATCARTVHTNIATLTVGRHCIHDSYNKLLPYRLTESVHWR